MTMNEIVEIVEDTELNTDENQIRKSVKIDKRVRKCIMNGAGVISRVKFKLSSLYIIYSLKSLSRLSKYI